MDGCQLGIEIVPTVAAAVGVQDDVIPLEEGEDCVGINAAAAEIVAVFLGQQAG